MRVTEPLHAVFISAILSASIGCATTGSSKNIKYVTAGPGELSSSGNLIDDLMILVGDTKPPNVEGVEIRVVVGAAGDEVLITSWQIGAIVPFYAMCYNSRQKRISCDIHWAVSNPNVLAVEPTKDNKVMIQAISEGSSTVTVTFGNLYKKVLGPYSITAH